MQTRILSSRTTFLFGLVAGVFLAQAIPVSHAAKAKPWTRVIIGLKQPLTPKDARDLKTSLGATTVTLMPGQTYVILLLRPGTSLAAVKAKSRHIAFLEPEVVMHVPPEKAFGAVMLTATREHKERAP